MSVCGWCALVEARYDGVLWHLSLARTSTAVQIYAGVEKLDVLAQAYLNLPDNMFIGIEPICLRPQQCIHKHVDCWLVKALCRCGPESALLYQSQARLEISAFTSMDCMPPRQVLAY